jgi:hypothetical protein
MSPTFGLHAALYVAFTALLHFTCGAIPFRLAPAGHSVHKFCALRASLRYLVCNPVICHCAYTDLVILPALKLWQPVASCVVYHSGGGRNEVINVQ